MNILQAAAGGELSPLGMMPKYQQFKVAGIFRSGFYNYDSAWAFIACPMRSGFSAFQIV